MHMHPQSTFIPAFVRELVYFDRNQHAPRTNDPAQQQQPPLDYISDNGLIILDTMQTSLPQAVLNSHVPTASQPEDFNPFHQSCIAVLDRLTQLIQRKGQKKEKDRDGLSEGRSSLSALLDLYGVDELGPWLGDSGRRATEVWFDLYTKGEHDQAWLVGSTILEQLIVNIIFTLQGPDRFIPFLVRDLLAVPCLTKSIDRTLIRVIKTLMGSPLTLNIRNLLWHGFIIPDDQIPLDAYGAMLIATTMSIAEAARQRLQEGLQIRHGTPKTNFYFHHHQQQQQEGGRSLVEPGSLGDLDAVYEQLAYGSGRLPFLLSESNHMSGSEGQDPLRLTLEAIVRKSSFVTIGTVGQWISALKHLEPAQNSTGDRSTTTTTPTSAPAANSSFMFVMASLPLLEHGLRLLYVRLNRCKEDRKSALIAGEYYLTLDVILDQFVPPEYFEADAPALKEYRLDAIPNLLHAKLGPKAMNLLHDLFLAALGPRLRDRTSHGELNVYFTKDIRTEPWFDYYLGVVVYLLTLDPDSIPDGYEDVAEGICHWVEQYSQRRFDEWSALRKEAVQALCMLSEYPATISPIAGGPGAAVEHDEMDEVVAIGGATAPVESWITLRLKPKSSTVFASSNTFDTSTLPNLQDRIQLCLSAWLTSPFSQTVTNVGTGNNNKAQGMASNLPAWLLIVQSVQGATEKVATKMATFLQLQSQRQLSSRSRKQLEAMKPLVPGWLGMLAGCLALVEHFVLAGGSTSFQTGNGSNVAEIAGVQSLSLSDNTGTPSPPTTSEGNKTPNKGRNIESPRNRSETPPRTMENSGAVDKSSAAEIRLRLAMVNFLNKFVSNFERVKLPMIEAAWFDLLKSVEPLLSE